MAQRRIGKPLKNLEFIPVTEKLSLALKSTSKNKINRNKGLWAEAKVIQLLSQKGCVLLEQRQKWPYGEVDLHFFSPHQNLFILVEVKFLHSPWMIFQRIKKAQISRLQKNLVYKRTQGCRCRGFICFVNWQAQIQFIDIENCYLNSV